MTGAAACRPVCGSGGVGARDRGDSGRAQAQIWNALQFIRPPCYVDRAPRRGARGAYRYGVRSLHQRVSARPGRPRSRLRTRDAHAGAAVRDRGRQAQLEVRVGRRTPLADRVQPHVGPRGGHGLPGPRHRPHPHRHRHHEPLPPGQPPGPLRRAGGHARPPPRGPVRVGDRTRRRQPRDRLVQHPRQELHQARVERGHPSDPTHVGGEGLYVRGRALHRALSPQHPPQALRGKGSSAHLGGMWQPGHLHPGRRARNRCHRLQLRADLQPEGPDRRLQGGHRQLQRAPGPVQERQCHDDQRGHLPE